MSTALHTFGGEVWAAADEQAPRPTGLSPTSYVLPAGGSARVLGTAGNAPLILSLAAQGVGLDLAGPAAVCPDAQDLSDPGVVLYRTRQCMLSGSLGGWHRYSEAVDGPAYRLAAAAPEDRLRVAADHPIWYDLQFLTGANQESLANVLAEIIDPRWFVDPHSPNRCGRLRCFFRVKPSAMRRLLDGAVSPGVQRLRLLISAMGPPSVPSDAPGDFLRRVVCNAEAAETGVLTACRLFLAYLVRVWEQRIQILSKGRQAEPLFLPELLFRDFEAQAWREFDLARPR